MWGLHKNSFHTQLSMEEEGKYGKVTKMSPKTHGTLDPEGQKVPNLSVIKF